MILCYLLFFLNFNLIKTAAKFMRNESVKCPARAVFAKSRARHVHIMSLNLLTSHLNYSISRVSYVHLSRTTDESLHYFVLPSEKQNAFARSADFEFQLILYLGPSKYWVRDCTQELIPLDISYDQILLFFFCKDRHKTLKYVDEFPE